MATHSHIAKAIRMNKGIKFKEEYVDEVVEAIADFINNNEKVSLKGLGIFERKEKGSRNGRNPATGETIVIPPKSVINFRADKSTIIVLKPAKKAAKK